MISPIEIRDYLMSVLPKAKLASAGKQIITICPFTNLGQCNDTKGHFYIGPFIDNGNDDIAIRYNCFKCNHSGLVKKDFLEFFGIYDETFSRIITEYNLKLNPMMGNKVGHITSYTLRNDYISSPEMSNKKLEYINKRLGLELTFDDIVKNKIVLNLYDILNSNCVSTLTRHPNIVQELNNSFIGFLSMDNNNVNMRNLREGRVYPTVDKKYINYNIFTSENNCKYYALPANIDLTDPRPIRVNIAEGPFDILGIYYNVMNQYNERSLYCAIGGKGYMNLIEYLLCNIGLMNMELHIYPDLDILQDTMYEIVGFLKPFNMDIYVHRNVYVDPETGKQEKDFGISKDRIIDSCVQLYKKIQ